MSDRLDLDALLISSLYGELSSTEEARLAAHLESHPADRTALADLTRARTMVRDSRFFVEATAEPPQQVSALLMQEAARRAPKKPAEHQEGWVARFLASLRSPAMAAAMMLVVVVGVAGTMYLRKGDQFASQSKSDELAQPAASNQAPAAGSAAPTPESGKLELATGTADFQVHLDEDAADKKQKLDYEGGAARPTGPTGKADSIGGLEVTTPMKRPMPKDLPEDDVGGDSYKPQKNEQQRRGFAAPPKNGTTPGMVATDGNATKGGNAEVSKTVTETAKSPASPPTQSFGGGAARDRVAPAPVVQQEKLEEKRGEKEKDTAETAWAKTQHAKVVDRARAGNCREAANLAVQLSNRAPAYYQQNVESDRDLKQCFTTINRERELDAERAQKARAKQRTDEPAPRPAESSK